jgi:glycosyltransferase involved in cell wall biosynthesis
VVSTAVGAEGLELNPGEHYSLANTPEEMAQSLLRCLKVPAAILAMADRGREAVERDYNWDALGLKLEKIWRRQANRQRKAAAE